LNVGPADRLDLTRAGEYGRAAPALEAILNLRAAVRDQGVNSVKTSTRATEVARTLRGGLGLMGFLVGLLAWGGTVLGADDPAGVAGGLVEQLGDQLPVWSVLPFVALLGCIALLPLFHGHWWEHNKNKAIISAGLSVPVILVLAGLFGSRGTHALVESLHEYLSFVCLLGALYIISGGVYVQGSLSGTPLLNTAVLALGAIIANFVGTTGASVLLIRPLLRANKARVRKTHIVIFFIFVVSNCGGLLTPLGDPPLFLGFLKGVPFLQTLSLWKQWLFVNGCLLAIFNVWDQKVLDAEEVDRPGSQLEEVQQHEPLRILGMHNLLLLAGVVLIVFCSGQRIGFGGQEWPHFLAQGLTAALAAISYFGTRRSIHESNRFTFGPILEVAILFLGIFITMTPALQILNARGDELGVREPWQFFWVSGALSSVLDNAPTYIAFAATACGIHNVSVEGQYLAEFLTLPIAWSLLAAISCGSVFMGANTYIGNGPNFMVKAIAEENGVPMPGFFGYMLYSGGILIPIFIVTSLLFFRG
jgi:Na+/H+ antiporter NhaD/arsenite permease-like protein